MDLNQFPERLRARVLAGIVRNSRVGIAIRLGRLDGETLSLRVSQEAPAVRPLPPAELEQVARTTFATLPYELRIQVG